MAFDLVLRGGKVYNSAGAVEQDIGISDSTIVAIGDLSGEIAKTVIDARGCIVLPGIIDSHVHFREPGLTHKEDLSTGSLATLFGGTTTFFEMPNTKPSTVDESSLQEKLFMAAGRTYGDHAFYIGATHENVDRLAAFEKLPGTPGIKIFVGSSTGSLLLDDHGLLESALKGGERPIAFHAENESRLRSRMQEYLAITPVEQRSPRDHPSIRDVEAAVLATEELVELCRKTRRPIHILHITSLDEVEIIQRAQAEQVPVTAEVLSHHLWFHAPKCYEEFGTFVQMNPPIRGREHQSALRQALVEGAFTTVGSDHAPHTLEEKSKPFPEAPSGIPGAQTSMPALVTLLQKLVDDPWTFVAKLMCENPARLFGVAGKGTLKPGNDADICIIDPSCKISFSKNLIKSKCGWSPYEGEELYGIPRDVILRGYEMIRDYALVGEPIGIPVRFDWK